MSLDYICGRTDKPDGKMFTARPNIGGDNEEISQFVEMCFDPKSKMSVKLKDTLYRMMKGAETADMDKCIYFKNSSASLTYFSNEHIFPASIGGIKTLEKGIVSDQANNIFSSLELVFSRNSHIKVSRQLYGIGKRGKRSDNANIQSATIEVIWSQEKEEYSLGYLLRGKPITIVQVHIDVEKDGIIGVSVPPHEQDFNLLDFVKEKLKEPLDVKIIKNKKLKKEAIVGYHRNRWYIAVSDDILVERCKTIMKAISLAEEVTQTPPQKNDSHVSVEYNCVIDASFYRVVAKISFNCLAYIFGQEIALDDSFDEIRNYILNGGENKYVTQQSTKLFQQGPFSKVVNIYNHFIFILKRGSYVLAYVSIFGMAWGVLLSENSITRIGEAGFVCDTERNEELHLSEYIGRHFTTGKGWTE